MKEAGTLLVELLEKQKVDRVYCVPGESYLSVMNGLQETSIETILCKHEGAASIMAEADGKLTGRYGTNNAGHGSVLLYDKFGNRGWFKTGKNS